MELELRLDPDGRTTFDSNVIEVSNSNALDYTSKTCLTLLAKGVDGDENEELLDDLLLDCEITDCALLPRTFWIGADETRRCTLEQMAFEVFHHHVHKDITYDQKCSGAEWWVQIRPSPPAGRYNLLCEKCPGADTEEDDIPDDHNGICFHWDKDEDLRLMAGGNLYIHPHLSTVTYLTSSGAPTIALNYRISPFSGEYEQRSEEEAVEAFLSWPKRGKHLSFDGRFLHAAPSNLMKEGEFNRQLNGDLYHNSGHKLDEAAQKRLQRRRRRCTFLVNIWLNYKPFNVDPFPETMIDKLSEIRENANGILLPDVSKQENQEKDKVIETYSYHHEGRSIDKSKGYTTFSWPMGGSGKNERIQMSLNLDEIQKQCDSGGNVALKWTCSLESERGICIFTDKHSDESNSKRQKIE